MSVPDRLHLVRHKDKYFYYKGLSILDMGIQVKRHLPSGGIAKFDFDVSTLGTDPLFMCCAGISRREAKHRYVPSTPRICLLCE